MKKPAAKTLVILAGAMSALFSCGIPLGVDSSLDDISAITRAMKVECTVKITGLGDDGLQDNVATRPEPGTTPFLFTVPGGPSWIVVPDQNYNSQPFFSANDTGYYQYADFNNATASRGNSGIYFFRIDTDGGEVRIPSSRFKSVYNTVSTTWEVPAHIYLPVNLFTGVIPYRMGLLGFQDGSASSLRAAILYNNGDGYSPHDRLSLLDGCTDLRKARVAQGLPAPYSPLYGSTTANLWDTWYPDQTSMLGACFPPPRTGANGETVHGLGILYLSGSDLLAHFGVPYQGGTEDWVNNSPSSSGYWPYTLPSTLVYAHSTNELSLAAGTVTIPTSGNWGVLSLQQGTETRWYLSPNSQVSAGNTQTLWGMDTSTTATSSILRGPIARFLSDTSPLALRDNKWYRSVLSDTTLVPDDIGADHTPPGLIFLFEHDSQDGEGTKLWFAQTFWQRDFGSKMLVLRTLSIKVSDWQALWD